MQKYAYSFKQEWVEEKIEQVKLQRILVWNFPSSAKYSLLNCYLWMWLAQDLSGAELNPLHLSVSAARIGMDHSKTSYDVKMIEHTLKINFKNNIN